MADKRISQLVERTDIANNDVVPIVASGATTTNKATISSIQTFMQENLDVGVTSVGITLGSAGTDVNVTGSPITTSGNITINIPDASTTARGVVTTGSQTFGGVKTFADGLVLPSAGGTNQASRFVNTTAIHQGSAGSNRIGFNSGNNIYFGKGLDNGGVIQWNNAAVRYYTLQDADGTLAFTSQLDGYVTLNTAQTITAQKVFNTSGSSDSVIITHGSGSGIALDVIKAGDGEAIRVTKTSGSGNAMTISGGNFEAGTIVKTGGTSSQFLKADGSVDSSTYLTTSSASSTYVPYTGATSDVDLGTRVLSANNLIANGNVNSGALLLKPQSAADTISINFFKLTPVGTTSINFGFSTGASTWKSFRFSSVLLTDNTPTIFQLPNGGGTLAVTTDLGAYLPLTGGTLTGALNGTSASFSSSVTATQFDVSSGNGMYNAGTNAVGFQTSGLARLYISSGGNVGIGNTIPGSFFSSARNLVVGTGSGNNGMSIYSGSSAVGDIAFADGTTDPAFYSGLIRYDHSLDAMRFFTASAERMRITSGGNVLISNGGQTDGALIVGRNGNNNSILAVSDANNTSEAYFRGFSTAVSASRIIIYSNGNIVNTNNSYGAISDIKLKENIEDTSPKLDDLMKVKVRNYNLIGDEKKQIGVIAQELEEVFPAMIDESEDFEEVEVPQLDEEGNEVLNEEGEVVTEKQRVSKGTSTKSVKYSVFVPMLIKAIQELKTEIDSLKNQMQ